MDRDNHLSAFDVDIARSAFKRWLVETGKDSDCDEADSFIADLVRELSGLDAVETLVKAIKGDLT